jgi:hypothetical protein
LGACRQSNSACYPQKKSMAKEKDIDEFVDIKVEQSEHKSISIKEWFDGSIITRKSISQQLPFILFLCFFGIIYIGNRYHAEKIVRDLDKIQQNVKDLRAESIITASELMRMSKQSEVLKLVKQEDIGLEESVEPPKKIKKL